MSKIVWALKQLLPLKYDSKYTANGVKYHSKWNMWFGRCYNVERTPIG